jgi:large subunit ribosomal protein L17
MRHKRKVKHFSRKSGPRKALIRGLVTSLVEHERISTTVEKAKELRRHVERAVTLAKNNTLAARRLLLSRYPNDNTVNSLLTNIAPRFASRPGGYTRIIKKGRRPGDAAEMAFIEFVDYDFETKSAKTADAPAAKTTKKSKAKTTAKSKETVEKPKVKVLAKKKTNNRVKMQKKSRQEARA